VRLQQWACSGGLNQSFSLVPVGGATWSYKATHGLVPDSWGLYDPTFWLVTPNISTDSATTISNAWIQWRSTTSFGRNNTIGM
jgi:hypothetical protein